MNMKWLRRRVSCTVLWSLYLLCGAGCNTVAAATLIKLKYDNSSPGRVVIQDRQYSSYCTLTRCAPNVDSQNFFSFVRLVQLGSNDSEYNFLAQMPGSKSVTMRDRDASVEMKVSMPGVFFTAIPLEGFTTDPNPFMGTLVGNCSLDYVYHNDYFASTLWKVNDTSTPTRCHFDTSTLLPVDLWYSNTGFAGAYQLEILEQGQIPAGVYRGLLKYTVGAIGAADILVGDNAMPTPSMVSLPFELTVNPELSVSFPEPADRVQLLPARGAQALADWAMAERKAEPLQARFPFAVNTNGPFRVSYRCGTLAANDRCALKTSTTATLAPFDTRLAWDNAPPPAQGYPAEGVSNGQGRTFGFAPRAGHYSGAFDLVMEDPSPLLTARGREWQGLVTFVFDTEL